MEGDPRARPVDPLRNRARARIAALRRSLALPLGIGAAVVLVPALASAQRLGGRPFRDRPFATEREEPPTGEAPGERALGESERILPTVPEPTPGELDALGARAGVVVRVLELSGNTAIAEEALLAAAAPYLGRPLDAADLERLRRALTAVYVDAGYVTSGAVLPEQVVQDGRLRVQIVEGRLDEIRINGAKRYRESVLRRRLARAEGPPVRVADVESALRVLSQDPRIARLDARLEPSATRGRSRLLVDLEEADPASLGFAFDNYQSPSVGAYAGYADAAHRNPLGLGDLLAAEVGVSEGLYRVEGHYSVPLHPLGPVLTLDARYSHADIIDPKAIEDLDVTNVSQSYSAGLRQTLFRTPRDWLEAGLAFDARRSESTIYGGDPFDFSAATDFGRSELRVLRGDASWTTRLRSAALTLRSIASFGLDALGATMHHGSGVPPALPPPAPQPYPKRHLPDGRFTSWVGQLRYFQRFEGTGIELDLRGDVQLSDRPLLPLEQFVIGGPGSVRGYRTNQLAGDEGFSTGVEVRVPIWRTVTGRRVVSLAPFAEAGRVWWKADRNSQDLGSKRTLSSLGLGLEWEPHPSFLFRFDWAGALRDTGLSSDLQDQGINFRVSWRPR